MNELTNDKNLREAVNRREQQLAPMPADLNERLMESLTTSKENENHQHFSSLSLWRGRGERLISNGTTFLPCFSSESCSRGWLD